ncbi:MAG: cyclic nucleotide-binding domain-containing protein [Cytophagales bacterium]|nr:cyclic nucleotide-binding domain-containing protein [Bernardetiaceae bacterium]MDW8203631.1 cyclic nucleotide-binding domain-containing protein [Cytophagales bacterium]
MRTEQNAVAALRQSALFKQLPKDILHTVAAKTKLRQFFPDETIVWQGDPSDSLYVITNGIVAVQRLGANHEMQTLAYLMPGNTFGEVGILENQPRSATVKAVTDVDVRVIKREHFMDILYQYPIVAIELAKMLGRYLLDANRRMARSSRARMILIINVFGGQGATSIGVLLANTLAEKTNTRTVYTEYPVPQKLITDLGLEKRTKVYKNKNGCDFLISLDDPALPDEVKTSFVLDYIINDYENIIVTLNESPDEDMDGNLDRDVIMLLDYVKQIILLIPPDKVKDAQLNHVQNLLRKHIRRDEVQIYTLVNSASEALQPYPADTQTDFYVPFIPDFPSVKLGKNDKPLVPAVLQNIFEVLIDRLERSNNIGIFIPTTIDVNKAIDTKPYVERTLNFLAERFGGATSKQAKGVWNSEQAGLVEETVYVVYTYVTHSDMNRHLDEVIEYVKSLKKELRQEAMAVEINKKLTLI